MYRCTLPSKRELTALSAKSINPTRSVSTRRVKTHSWLRVREDMMPSKKVSEVKPNPSSERRPRLPRRSPSSLNAQSAREEDLTQSSVARLSFLEKRKTPRATQSTER